MGRRDYSSTYILHVPTWMLTNQIKAAIQTLNSNERNAEEPLKYC
jgi:hypothetical protein